MSAARPSGRPRASPTRTRPTTPASGAAPGPGRGVPRASVGAPASGYRAGRCCVGVRPRCGPHRGKVDASWRVSLRCFLRVDLPRATPVGVVCFGPEGKDKEIDAVGVLDYRPHQAGEIGQGRCLATKPHIAHAIRVLAVEGIEPLDIMPAAGRATPLGHTPAPIATWQAVVTPWSARRCRFVLRPLQSWVWCPRRAQVEGSAPG